MCVGVIINKLPVACALFCSQWPLLSAGPWKSRLNLNIIKQYWQIIGKIKLSLWNHYINWNSLNLSKFYSYLFNIRIYRNSAVQTGLPSYK